MFAFLCPIRHPASSNDYAGVIRYLQLTIESVCNQKTDEDFVFIVVCNEKPDIDVPEDIVKFVVVDFPPPDNNRGTAVPMEVFTYDKGTKLARGLVALKEYNPDYVYIIDGDDWVNVDVVNAVKDSQADVWYTDDAYVVNMANHTSLKKFGVCRYCGSTYIYRFNTLMTVTGLGALADENPTQETLTQTIDKYVLHNILGNHRYQFHFFQSRGMSLKKIPLPSTCWILNTGENHSGKDGGECGINLTTAFLSQFGIRSLAIEEKSTPLTQRLCAYTESFKSWLGWQKADKNAEKV